MAHSDRAFLTDSIAMTFLNFIAKLVERLTSSKCDDLKTAIESALTAPRGTLAAPSATRAAAAASHGTRRCTLASS